MRCETTSSVKECALRARSTHGVHHAIVEVNIVIGVVLGEVLVARVVPLVADAVIGLALSLIAHVVVVVFVVAILHRIFLYGRFSLYILRPTLKSWSVGATLMKFTWANISERRILVSNFRVTRNSFREFHTLDWFLHV